jgi:Rps23 Pro-64 3,4-dihydroxylase Tpa1-like proline 4-hydroxylase
VIQPKPDKEIKALRQKFNKNGFVIIPDYFELDYAKKIRKYIAQDIPEDSWYEAFSPVLDEDLEIAGDGYRNRMLPISNTTLPQRKARAAFARNAAGNGSFAYNFDRTMNCSPSCRCVLCEMKEVYESVEVTHMLNKITALDLGKTNTMFASRYSANHFLSSHTDTDRGVLGVVYYINTDWNSTWGGLLHIQDESQKTEEVISPEFNSIGLFTLPKAHFVSQIANYSKWSRYNHVAWYDRRKEEYDKLPRDKEDFEE